MRHVPILIGAVLAIAAMTPASVRADPARKPALECTAGGLTAPPKFTQLSPGRAEYSFSGACISGDGHSFAYRIDATWTPPENGKGNANATEILHIDMTSGPSQSYSILVGARCNADPWLYSVNCERIGDDVPDEVRAWWYDVTSAPFPFSRLGIPHDQRAVLRKQYDRAYGVFEAGEAYSDRAAIETIDIFSTQATGRDMTGQTIPAATRVDGAEAGIIIVSGNAPHQPASNGETSMAELQSVMGNRATTMQLATGMLSSVNEATRNVTGNIGGGASTPSPQPDPPICVNARAARARNSPAAPGLEAQCLAAGGRL